MIETGLGTRRALVCSVKLPEYDRDRGSLRVLELVEFLEEAGWSITYVANSTTGGERYARMLRQRGIPTYEAADPNLDEVIASGRFDLALLEYWHVAEGLIPRIRALSPATRIVIDSLDVHFLREARRAVRGPGPGHANGGHGGGRGDAMARELSTYAAADAVLAVSDKETALLGDVLGDATAIHTLTLSESYTRSTVPFAERNGLLFVGNFHHLPNGEAVEYLCRSVLPRIPHDLIAEHPLRVVGHALAQRVQLSDRDLLHVQMVGWVPSVLPYLERARVSVVPLLHGAGVKGKVLQSLVLGTPVVSTSIGVEGIELVPDEHVLVADEPAAFAEAVTRLLRDADLWERLARAGHERVGALHSRDVVRARFWEIIAGVLGPGRRSARDRTPSFEPPAATGREPATGHAALREIIRDHVPVGATVVVLGRPDEVPQMPGRRTWPFAPRSPAGRDAGEGPPDVASGLPSPEEPVERGDRTRPTHAWDSGSYRDLVERIRARVRQVVPAGATVAVVSRGDDRLVQLGDRRGWHFPRAEGGGYAGHYPADGAAAVEHLEALRAEGAGYLVLPATASWWLEHYPELRRRLEEPGRAVHRDDDCTVYALGDQAPEPARSAAAPVAREAGPEPADGDAAIRLLDELHAAGAEYVLVPRAALDWLEQYPGLRQRLEGADHATAHRTGAGTVFALGPAASPPVAGRPGEPPRATGQGAVVRRSSGPRAAGQREVLVLGTGRAGRGAEELAERLASKGRYAVEQRWVALAEGAAKFEAVNELLVGEDLGRYEYVVVADGELDVPDGFLDDFLGLQEELGFALAQPAYDIESSPTHPMVGRQLGVVARETRLVIPEPLVSIHRSAFDLILPFDAEAPRGYGYENVWPLLLGRRGLRMGVIDATPVAWAPAPPPVTAVDERKAFLQRRGHLPFDVCSTVLDAYTRRDGALRALVEGRTVYLPLISAVVATYNRADLLEHALESLVDQTLAKELYEVVVVDDGSTDATAELCRTFMPRLNLRYMRIDHAGRSGAKNMGVFVARAPIVLLFDDDDAAERNLLEEHVEAHRQHADESVAILGYTTWAPSLAVTPVMEYATEIGQKLFAYRNLRDGQVLGFAHFWEGRLSCKRAFLLERGVHDQRLNYTIDIELGYRLSKHGLRVIYDRSAVSYMVRPITFDEMCRRSEGKGAAELRFSRLHPRDPAIQRYCHVGDAAGIWQDAAPLLEKRVRRVHALEERLARKVARAGAGKALEELRALYGWCFDAFRAKGIVEEIQRTAASPSATAPLPSARLSIVVPLWNVTVELAEMTARHLARVREVAQMDVQIVVVDNGSPHRVPTDADVTIEWSENRGIAAAWNAGADAASGDVLCFFNNDVWVEPGWDVALHQAAHDGRRIVFPYTDHGDGASVRPDTAGVAGWCFALSRAVWQEVGRFDESFGPAFFEDTDYFHRAWERGIDLNPVPVARVRHVRRTTASRQPHVEWLFQAHRLKYGWKHGVDPTKPPPFYLREIVDYGSAPAAAPG